MKDGNSLIGKISKYKYEVLILIFSFVFLYPILNTGYYYDDIFNATTHGAILNLYNSPIEMFFSIVGFWFGMGRVFPLGFLCYFMYDAFNYCANPLLVYKLFLILANLAVILVFGILVEKLTESKRAKLISMLGSVLFFQATLHHFNAIYAFHGLLQATFLFGALSLIYAIDAVKTGKIKYRILSSVFLCFALLTYEVGFAFIIPVLIIPFILIKRDTKKSIKYIAPQALVIACILAVNLCTRIMASQNYGGTSVDISSLSLVALTFLKQFIAAVPLAQTFLNDGVLQNAMRQVDIYDVVTLVLFALLSFFLFFKQKTQKEPAPNRNACLLIITGLSLWIIPSGLIAVSQRYQMELQFGIAHLPVYVESFGVICIIAGIILLLKSKFALSKKRPLIFILLMVFSLPVLLINIKTMSAFFDSTKADILVSRNVTEQAIKSGFYDEQNDKNLLLFDEGDNVFAMPCGDIFANYAGRKIEAYEINQYVAQHAEFSATAEYKNDGNDDISVTKEIYYGLDGGVIVKGKLRGIAKDSQNEITSVYLDCVQLYIKLADDKTSYVLDYIIRTDTNETVPQNILLNTLDDEKGHVFSLPEDETIDMRSMMVH